ncbi:hypothetical protein EV426DRAFT_430149 [Tirmania nivea]|nr:hypothetical protein EV426DRAFT_430149 [Tirmania nivea]
MSGRSKCPGSAKMVRTTKGKTKAPCGDHDSSTPRPGSLPGMAVPSPWVRRQLPNLAPKSESINPEEPLQLRKRPRVDRDLQSPSQLPLDDFARPERNRTLEQPIYLTNDTWSHSNIQSIDTAFAGSTPLSLANVVKSSESQLQSLASPFDPLSGHQNTSQAATACSLDIPSIFQPPLTTTITENSQMQITQANRGYCPRCFAMLRNLRESIIAITCGQALPSEATGELWKSYFGLEDHWNEEHVSGVGGLAR